MSDSRTVAPSVRDLIRSFAEAAPEARDEEFLRLTGALWVEGELTSRAQAATADLLAHLDVVDEDLRGHLLILLGLLAEAEYPAVDGPVTQAVRGGLDRYLALLDDAAEDEPLTFALLYLLSHLPEDRDRVLTATARLPLAPEDATRLRRCLATLDPADVVLGRVWPSPHEWSLNDSERDFDRGWIDQLTPEQLLATWRSDTRSVLAYTGAKALWSVRNGGPTVVTDVSPLAAPAATPPADGTGLLARHLDALCCPTCRARLTLSDAVAHCTSCARAYRHARGVLDLLAEGDARPDEDDVLQNATGMTGIGHYYETVLRPAFLRVMGSNWGGDVTPSVEDAYLTEHLAAVNGPVLDLGAGAGRWTAIAAEVFGEERVIALDVIGPMLSELRGRLPGVAAVRGSALTLPFGEAALGAVNCWNALQALPDPAAALHEIGRCLRTGGTLTLMTFRWGGDPIYRYFQHAHSFPGSPDGIVLFEDEQITDWLTEAGLRITHRTSIGGVVLLTAVRRR
ncbi:SAM-dependent methyltransferase [Actinoalloteichus hoggarensis]|uniref:Uncharacterized protein n=1 Tax=Actinoalloteichus hoggarensis TaxID=1470176 RepID=A0A221W5F1_9PSEU|nr:methyltransferase domain-containing protein [Actinoalloteichus hoggarensis]ASO20921.1 hypothetical protein AHOG_16475 [Actinoalloteichus hoggarensis]MBB5920851.1 SAM-dependent methyltransferase [Actinoalloteichus hoggarensis]